MELRELLKQDFGLDLPISGGSGNGKDNAIIIGKTPDYVAVEYAIVRCLCIGRDVDYEFLSQNLVEEGGREYDMLRVETRWVEGDQDITQIERYWFDISANY